MVSHPTSSFPLALRPCAAALGGTLRRGPPPSPWGHTHRGAIPPAVCPRCLAPASCSLATLSVKQRCLPVQLLLGWWGADDLQLRKYSGLLNGWGFPTLRAICPRWQVGRVTLVVWRGQGRPVAWPHAQARVVCPGWISRVCAAEWIIGVQYQRMLLEGPGHSQLPPTKGRPGPHPAGPCRPHRLAGPRWRQVAMRAPG